MTPAPQVSVVLPAKDESASIAAVVEAIAAALDDVPHEIVVVDDGSGDDMLAVLQALAPGLPQLRILHHDRACGQSAALRSGIQAARGRIIATLDADGQNPPDNLPRLIAPFLAAGTDPLLGLVQGQRLRRQDTWSKRMASKLANRVRQMILRDGVRDSGCGMKVFPRAVYLNIAYFDHLHRFMPAMVRREGLAVVTMDVTHSERYGGQSKYNNLQRGLVGIVDLLGVAWLARRRRLPAVSEVALPDAPAKPPRNLLH